MLELFLDSKMWTNVILSLRVGKRHLLGLIYDKIYAIWTGKYLQIKIASYLETSDFL